MKQNRLIKLLAAGAVSAVALSTSFAQTETHETTTTAGTGGTGVSATTTTGGTGVSATTTTGGVGVSSTTSTSSLDGTGTITTYTPGSDFISFRTSATTEPMKYYYTKNTTVVDSDGKTVEWSMLRPEMPVRYTYVKEGDRMVVSKVTITKPISTWEKTTTTTTTTKP